MTDWKARCEQAEAEWKRLSDELVDKHNALLDAEAELAHETEVLQRRLAELAALKESSRSWGKLMHEQMDELAALKAENERLKCCGNCKKYEQKSGDELMHCYAFSDPDECEDASPFDRCHFTSSRWEARP